MWCTDFVRYSVEDNVFIGLNVIFCNDKYPKLGNKNWTLGKIVIKNVTSIVDNTTIFTDVIIGENNMFGAGSVVNHNVVSNNTVVGNSEIVLHKK